MLNDKAAGPFGGMIKTLKNGTFKGEKCGNRDKAYNEASTGNVTTSEYGGNGPMAQHTEVPDYYYASGTGNKHPLQTEKGEKGMPIKQHTVAPSYNKPSVV